VVGVKWPPAWELAESSVDILQKVLYWNLEGRDAEEYLQLIFIARKRLLKTLQVVEDSAGNLWKSAIAL
jgi:hypothetical protein